MSEYTPTLEDAKRTYAYIQGGLDHDEGYKPFYQVHEEAVDRLIAEVERAAAARALEEAVIDFESGEVTDQDIKYSTSAPKGWSDACVHDAIVASGPIMDWLRARAAEIREGKNE